MSRRAVTVLPVVAPARQLHQRYAAGGAGDRAGLHEPPGDRAGLHEPAGDRRHLHRARKVPRRWWAWVTGVVVAATLGAMVVTDLPVHASAGYRRQALRGYLATVAGDVAQCRAGLHDAVVAYVGATTGTPHVARGVPATFAAQAVAVCGFDNSGVVDLGTTEPLRTIAGPVVDRIGPQVDAWAYLDAFTLLQDLRAVMAQPSAAGPRAAFSQELAALTARRHTIEQLVATAQRSLGAPPRPLPLTDVGALLPGGRLPYSHGPRS